MKKKLVFGLIFLLVAFGALEAQYHFFLKANRYWSNAGDFSTDGLITSIGVNGYTEIDGRDILTTRGNGLRLAYSGGRYTEMVANDEGEFEISKLCSRDGEGESSLQFWTEWAGKDEHRKGVINIFATRETVCTSPGGSADFGMQIYVRNNATNLPVTIGESTSYHNLRGMECIASNKDSGARTAEIIAAYFSAESRSGTISTHIKAIQAIYDQSGDSNTSNTGVYVQCNSQSDVGTSYGVQIVTTNYNQVREYALFIDSTAGSWTNAISFNGTISSAFDFEGTDGTSAAYYEAGMSDDGSTANDLDGWIRVTIDGNVLYILCYKNIPT